MFGLDPFELCNDNNALKGNHREKSASSAPVSHQSTGHATKVNALRWTTTKMTFPFQLLERRLARWTLAPRSLFGTLLQRATYGRSPQRPDDGATPPERENARRDRRRKNKPRGSYILETKHGEDRDRHGSEEWLDARNPDQMFEEHYSEIGSSRVMEQAEELCDDYYREKFSRRRRAIAKIVEKKYFRPPPDANLLSWAAKRQIRHLHRSDPEEWTPEQLAEKFPVSAEGVQKLLKSRDDVRSEEQIRKHDEKIAANWKTLGLNGGPIVPAAEKESEKRTQRTSNAPRATLADERAQPPSKLGAFSSIIPRYQKEDHRNETQTIGGTVSRTTDMFGILHAGRKPITAEEFKRKAIDLIEINKTLDNKEKQTLSDGLLRPTDAPSKKFDAFSPGNGTVSQRHAEPDDPSLDEEQFYRETYPVANTVPLKIDVGVREKKKLHRYKDAYYDEEGNFLYRVPGIG